MPDAAGELERCQGDEAGVGVEARAGERLGARLTLGERVEQRLELGQLAVVVDGRAPERMPNSSSSTSSGRARSAAPLCASSACGPAANGEVTRPGTAPTGLESSRA